MAAKDELGRAGERRAEAYLRAHGYEILDRNWRTTGGEIDIVARQGRDVVVVEVKTRSTDDFGHPFEAVTADKAARLWRLGAAWAAEHPEHASGRSLRVDAVAIIGPAPRVGRLEHLEDLR